MTAKARDILTSIGEVVYDWTAYGDRLRWSNNVIEVLGPEDLTKLSTGRDFAGCITPETIATRYRAIFGSGLSDDGRGVPFECNYCLAPNGLDRKERLWVEEIGRWFVGDNGRAKRVYGSIRVINERHNQDRRLRFISQFDELTGLFNQSVFFNQLERAVTRSKSGDYAACYLVAQIDNFRSVNEAYGFDIADQVIREVAKRISRRMRDGDLVGRISGARYGLLINNCTKKEMKAASERFLEAIRGELIVTDAGPVHVTITMGGVYLGEGVSDLRMARMCALDALDQAKHYHFGTFRAYSAEPFVKAERDAIIRMTDEITAALNGRTIELAYQPVVDAESEEPVFYEALLRVNGNDGKPIPAGDFVEFSERLGFSAMLDHRVLELALNALFSYPTARISINASSDIGMDQEWFSYLTARIGNYRDVAARLIVEIPESTAFRHLEETMVFIQKLHGLGVRVAIDNFGAGYSSFRNLQEMNIDLVKINGGFIQDLIDNSKNRAFVSLFADLAKELEIEVVAKWIENTELAETLKEIGVDYLQGYYYGKADKHVFVSEEESGLTQRSQGSKT